MAVTCGFYNALNHDRLYDAIQMSSIFDGIIQDGVFSTIGDSLIVTSPEDGMYVDVGPGRAWFNHTWTLNDTEYPVEAEEAEVVLDRIDAVVLEVNANPEVRNNRIYFVKGTPSSNPVKPTMIHNAEVNQYALAYVHIRAGQTTIFQSDIENAVGTDETPFVTGLLQQVSVEQLLLQWNDDFYRYFASFQRTSTAEFTTWLLAKKDEYDTWYAAMEAEGATDLETFDTWFQHMKDQLDSDAAGHLQAEIDALAEDCEKGSVFTVTTEEPELVNRTCYISQGSDRIGKQFDANGVAEFPSMPYIGAIHIESTDGDDVAQGDMNIPYFGRYSINIAFWAATLNISTSADGLIERPITITKGGEIVGTTSFNASGRATYKVHEPGTYVVTSSTAGGDEYSATVVVTEETAYPVNLGIPSGATAVPTDDIQIWLKCASIYNRNVSVLADIMDDYYLMEKLFSDSNACDYMARSTSWAALMTADPAVMVLIGRYDYCRKKLLSNATWRTAIINSDYWECIYDIYIPKLTGADSRTNVTSEYDAGHAAWNALDRTTSTWWATGYQVLSGHIQWDFTNPVVITDAVITFAGSVLADSVVIEAYNGTSWIPISDTIDVSDHSLTPYIIHLENTDAYRYYGATVSVGSGAYTGIAELQFCGYETAQPTVDTIHSAALDTIYYYDSNSVERQLCVTDANGNGTVDWSEMEPGIYTFYSSVAKKWYALNEDYSRTVKITKTTTEVYLMEPNAIYWYGFVANDGEDMSPANGWSYTNWTLSAPVHNPYKLTMNTGSTEIIGFGSKNPVPRTAMAGLQQGVRLNAGSQYAGILSQTNGKSTWQGLGSQALTSVTSGVTYMESEPNQNDNITTGHITYRSQQGSASDMHALWYKDRKNTTIYSAPYDIIYYIDDNNIRHDLCMTGGGGQGTIDWNVLPFGTYTLHSSVARDIVNPSTAMYTKEVTIGPDTKEIWMMPSEGDDVIYWFGYRGRKFTFLNDWTWSGQSWGGNITFNPNQVNFATTAGQYIWNGMGSSQMIDAGRTICTIMIGLGGGPGNASGALIGCRNKVATDQVANINFRTDPSNYYPYYVQMQAAGYFGVVAMQGEAQDMFALWVED